MGRPRQAGRYPRQAPAPSGQACDSRVRTPTLAWTENLDPSKRAVYAGADGAVDPESISGTSFLIASALVLYLPYI